MCLPDTLEPRCQPQQRRPILFSQGAEVRQQGLLLTIHRLRPGGMAIGARACGTQRRAQSPGEVVGAQLMEFREQVVGSPRRVVQTFHIAVLTLPGDLPQAEA